LLRASLSVLTFVALFIAACSGAPNQAFPVTNNPDASIRLSSSSSSLSFASLVGKDILDKDIERFIDPQITGSDRVLALKLMRIMPKNQRGDFVYIRPDGSVLSNRLAISALLQAQRVQIPQPSVASRTIQPRDLYPPAPFTGTGPYVEQYSVMGVTAFLGYVVAPCLGADATFFNKDGGYLYTGTQLYTGVQGTGSTIDAGLQYNPGDGSIQPFLRGNATGQQWYNITQHYNCSNGTLGIQYGFVPNNLLMFLATGVPVPPPPAGPLSGNSSITWIDAAWVYFNEPYDFNQPGTDATGAQTPCSQCITKRITSIAQELLNGQLVDNPYDGSCFGGCKGLYDASIEWSTIEMGQLTQCSPFSQSCTITFLTSGGWNGGLQNWDAGNLTGIHIGGGSETAFTAFEGIAMVVDPTPTPRPSPSGGGGGGGGGGGNCGGHRCFAPIQPSPTPSK